jgi:hypothetical protein
MGKKVEGASVGWWVGSGIGTLVGKGVVGSGEGKGMGTEEG